MDELFELIDERTTILTPNRRLSATLHKHYQEQQLQSGNYIWQTPDILPLASWIQRLWQTETTKIFDNHKLVLNPTQEQFLWEKIVLENKDSAQLLQVAETADIAKSAWALLKQWCVDLNNPLFHSAEDYSALYAWAMEFETRCEKRHLIAPASLPERINDYPKQQIILIGFNELSPQLRTLLQRAEQAGCTVINMHLTQSNESIHRIGLADSEEEILTIARWAKSIHSQDKTLRIGCVIPTLDKIRDRVHQVFSHVFASSDALTIDPDQCPFNISAGKSLSLYPIIHAALQLLGLHKKQLPLEEFSSILATPFIGDAEAERSKRASFDSLLRQGNINLIDLNKIVAETEDKKQILLSNHCGKLSRRLKQFLTQLNDYTDPHQYSAWAKIFTQLLTILGWPGERSLSSIEYQIVESWLNLLNDYTTLDQVGMPVNIEQALHALHKIASKTVFQPKTPEAPIQVLGILEAAALPFDYLWIGGLDDLSWPPQPKPNPFIPKKLQRELHMPHATAERELIYCEQLTTQFKQSAKHVIFSYAEKNEELELQPSPLIRDLAEINIEALHLDPYVAPSARIFAAKSVESIIDDTAPMLTADNKIRGGTDVIKQQALCPFKAFATHRLYARELEEPLPGLRPKDRGTIIHKVLEIIWNHLQDQANLLRLDDVKLNELISTSIESALKLYPNARSDYKQYISLEKQRLHKLINDWLDLEKQREPFSVSTSEKRAEITLGQLKLSVQIDRIDALNNGKKLIIDYKTGRNNEINKWLGERPEEPQLPLYALIDPTNTIGITFAQVVQGENSFDGLSQYSLDIKGIKPVSEVKNITALNWEQQLMQWKNILTKLSDDFYHGIATVDPKDAPQTCEYCKLKPLCRIYEEAI